MSMTVMGSPEGKKCVLDIVYIVCWQRVTVGRGNISAEMSGRSMELEHFTRNIIKYKGTREPAYKSLARCSNLRSLDALQDLLR